MSKFKPLTAFYNKKGELLPDDQQAENLDAFALLMLADVFEDVGFPLEKSLDAANAVRQVAIATAWALLQLEKPELQSTVRELLAETRKGGRPKKHSEQLLFECFGRVLAKCAPSDLNPDRLEILADKVLNEYVDRSGMEEHTHHRRWVLAFLRAYTCPE